MATSKKPQAKAPVKSPAKPKKTPVEVVSADTLRKGEEPLVTIKTGKTNNEKVYFKINQPKGRALLIAVHL